MLQESILKVIFGNQIFTDSESLNAGQSWQVSARMWFTSSCPQNSIPRRLFSKLKENQGPKYFQPFNLPLYAVAWYYSPVFQMPCACKHKSIPTMLVSEPCYWGDYVLWFAKRLPDLVRRGTFSVHFGSAQESKGSKLTLLDVSFHKMWVGILSSQTGSEWLIQHVLDVLSSVISWHLLSTFVWLC